MILNLIVFSNSTLQSPIEPKYDIIESTLQINHLLSFIQSFVLIMISQISDRSIISYLIIQTTTNTHIAFLSCTMASIILIFLFSITGYGITLCFPFDLINSIAIISSLLYLCFLLNKTAKYSPIL